MVASKSNHTNQIIHVYPKPIAKAIVNTIDRTVERLYHGEERDHSSNEEYSIVMKKEVKLGKLLGTGTFSTVYELQRLTSSSQSSKNNSSSNDEEQLEGFALYSNIRKTFHNKPKRVVTRSSNKALYTNDQGRRRRQELLESVENDTRKYAVKQLKQASMSNPKKFAHAAADLFIEAQILTEINHENIISIHGWAAGGFSAYETGHYDAFFILIDRLQETLQDRIDRWRVERKTAEASTNNMKPQHQGQQEYITRTLTVATQVASALHYLHTEKRIVFRDLKPNNVGFDESGTVKLFDFGLARHLPEEEEAIHDVYKMSGKIGTLRFMAPECALKRSYNEKVDTYSWAMLFWNCLTLEKPYDGISYSDLEDNVFLGDERPPLNLMEWPLTIQRLLIESWAGNIDQRLSMSMVCERLSDIEKDIEAAAVSKKTVNKMGISSSQRHSSSSIVIRRRSSRARAA